MPAFAARVDRCNLIAIAGSSAMATTYADATKAKPTTKAGRRAAKKAAAKPSATPTAKATAPANAAPPNLHGLNAATIAIAAPQANASANPAAVASTAAAAEEPPVFKNCDEGLQIWRPRPVTTSSN